MRLTEASQDFDLTFDELQGLISCFGRSSFLFLPKTTTSTDAVVFMLLNEFSRCSTKLPPLFFSRADSDMHLVNVMRYHSKWPSCAVTTASSQDADLGKRVGLHVDWNSGEFSFKAYEPFKFGLTNRTLFISISSEQFLHTIPNVSISVAIQ